MAFFSALVGVNCNNMLKKNISIIWLSILLIFISISSCQSEKTFNRIFFGGQIINPSASFVTLYKDNKTIDCLSLNNNYRFFKYYDSLDVGIYKLEHIPEYKSVFLEKGDSIWVRINASSFNESIVYSGRGAAKNNFMMDLLLSYDKENSFLSSKYSNDGVSFKNLIDSLLDQKKKRWMKMDSINQLTPIARKITQAAYIYPYATRKERYALLRGTNWSKIESKSFFDYRKNLSLEETDLAFFDPYINYLMNYLSEKALDSAQNYFRNKQSTEHNIKRLKLINELISGSVLKNNLARAVAFEELLNLENHKNHDEFLNQFLVVNNSNSHFKEVLGLEKTKQQLIGALDKRRIAHSQLFSGPKGSGKLALAVAYAQFINCESLIKLSCKLSRDSFIVFSSCFPIKVTSKLASLSKRFTCGIPLTLKFLIYFSNLGLSTFKKTKLISFSYSSFISANFGAISLQTSHHSA